MPTDHSEGDIKVNNILPTYPSEVYRKVNSNSPTDRPEGDRKLNKNSPSNQTEGENSRYIETNISPQRDQVRASSRQNKNSSSSMVLEGDNENDEYYVPIQTRYYRRIIRPNSFGQLAAISLGLLTFQCNTFPQTLQPGSIDTITD